MESVAASIRELVKHAQDGNGIQVETHVAVITGDLEPLLKPMPLPYSTGARSATLPVYGAILGGFGMARTLNVLNAIKRGARAYGAGNPTKGLASFKLALKIWTASTK